MKRSNLLARLCLLNEGGERKEAEGAHELEWQQRILNEVRGRFRSVDESKRRKKRVTCTGHKKGASRLASQNNSWLTPVLVMKGSYAHAVQIVGSINNLYVASQPRRYTLIGYMILSLL